MQQLQNLLKGRIRSQPYISITYKILYIIILLLLLNIQFLACAEHGAETPTNV
jgi:hypothetical protein